MKEVSGILETNGRNQVILNRTADSKGIEGEQVRGMNVTSD